MFDAQANAHKIKKGEIVRVREQQKSREEDCLIREIPLTVFFNGREYVTLLCLPEKLDCLAAGFLYLEGLLGSGKDLQDIDVDGERGRVFVRTKMPSARLEKPHHRKATASGLGQGTIFAGVPGFLPGRRVKSPLQVKAGELFALMDKLQKVSLLFQNTGGVHTAALAVPEKIIFYSEDVGRHNTVDKIAGESLLKDVSMEDKILLSSGRVSAEIISKGVKMGLPLIVSRSAPTALSVELADQAGITLVGFVRGRVLNIYTHENRVLV